MFIFIMVLLMTDYKNKLVDKFTEIIFEKYEVGENQARFLFERWNNSKICEASEIGTFLGSMGDTLTGHRTLTTE